MVSAELDMPGSVAHTVIVLCCCSKTCYSMDCYPTVDFKVFLDMQFHTIANDPSFDGLGGLSAWILRYADDETIRWMSKVYRHYAIEGRRTLLSDKYGYAYELRHIENPDFGKGLEGWFVAPASEGSILTGKMKGFGVAGGQ